MLTTPRSRAAWLGWLLGPASIALAGCGGVEVADSPRVHPQLVPQLSGVEAPSGPRDDYWTESLGTYLRSEELQNYWLLPEEQRFQAFGDRWLEFCLREDLLSQHRGDLSPEETDRFRAEPDFESSRRALQGMLADEPESPKEPR